MAEAQRVATEASEVCSAAYVRAGMLPPPSRSRRAIGGDWLFDVSLWVHEWDRLVMLLWEVHVSALERGGKHHVSLLRSALSSS
jgi:hypothetical protein